MCGEWVYHYEFKINRDAECALDQIKEKEYFRKYQHSGKRLILIGANFNMETRQLDDGKQEEVSLYPCFQKTCRNVNLSPENSGISHEIYGFNNLVLHFP